MKVLVTGGAGFIATNFMYYMVNKYPEYDFVNLDALTYAGNYNNIKDLEGKPNYKFVKGDITDREFIDKLFEEEKFDWVVNFAAESHVDNSIKNPGIFLTTNILGTQVLMDASRKYGIKRYHQVSTDEVYGDLPLDRPDLLFTEETPIHQVRLVLIYLLEHIIEHMDYLLLFLDVQITMGHINSQKNLFLLLFQKL